MVRAARAILTGMKRAIATDGDNTGNGYSKEGDEHSMAVTMGTAQRTWLLAIQLEREG
jgi:hypothetical protein